MRNERTPIRRRHHTRRLIDPDTDPDVWWPPKPPESHRTDHWGPGMSETSEQEGDASDE